MIISDRYSTKIINVSGIRFARATMNLNTAWVLTILGACLVSGNPMYEPKNNNTFSKLANIYSRFSDKLVKTICNSLQGNFAVSPLSLTESLLIALTGAGGKTKKELYTVLQLPNPRNKELSYNLALIEELNSLNGSLQGEVKLLNSLYVKNTFNLHPKKKKSIKRKFLATIENVDFTDAQYITNYINEYVKINTKGTIKDVVKHDMFNSNTVMVLVNVLYFQSYWLGFKDSEGLQDFHVGNRKVVKTPMIQADEFYECFESKTLKIASIPFVNPNLKMTLVMSTTDEYVLPSLSESLDLIRGKEKYVRVVLPKFIIESEHNLVPIMETMGVKNMFSSRSANFTKFTHGKSRGIYVSSLIQKAYIKVHSIGVEASAATAMTVGFRSLGPGKPSRSLCFDRPFYAYITYKSVPLFAIQVNDPRSSSTS